MRTLRTAGLAIAVVVLGAGASAQEASSHGAGAVSRPTITVANFDTDRTGWMPPPHLGDTLAELLTDRLVSAGPYRVVDRQWLVSPSSSDGVGRVPFAAVLDRAASAGIDYLVAGAVTRLSVEKTSSTTGGVAPLPVVGGLFHKNRTESVLGLVIRLIDVRTGEVVATSTAESGASHEDKSGGGFVIVAHVPLVAGHGGSTQGFEDRLLSETMQQAVTLAAERLVAWASTRGSR